MRKFTSTGSQVAVVAVRPLAPLLPPPSPAVLYTIAGEEDDVKSEASYDPLFDDEPEDGGAKGSATNNAKNTNNSTTTAAANTLLVPPTSASTTRTHYTRGPSVLDASTYSTFSPDVLMTASIDGSVVLWDRRVQSPGRGVGRLEMSSKTPPWCVSVSIPPSAPRGETADTDVIHHLLAPLFYIIVYIFRSILQRLAGPQMGDKYTLDAGTAPSMCGIRVNSPLYLIPKASTATTLPRVRTRTLAGVAGDRAQVV